jgi:hypothetical protein
VNPTNVEILATVLFGLAILHVFSVKQFHRLAHRAKDGSVLENLFHMLAEVEVVFGLWAAAFVIGLAALEGVEPAVHYLEGHYHTAAGKTVHIDFTEPAFVFVIMTMAASRPILELASKAINGLSRLLPLSPSIAFFVVALILGPLLGSFITEPAAMTVTALLLRDRFYDHGPSNRLKYATLGLLFVNISIGGTLTNFAAPPVLMVAEKFNWDMSYMMGHFGWKAAVAVIISTLVVAAVHAKELRKFDDVAPDAAPEGLMPVPIWLYAVHVAFLVDVVVFSHHMVMFFGGFLFFLGVVQVTQEYQERLALREGLLVGFFLGGLVILGGLQGWWLTPVLSNLGELPLFLGATGLTAMTDNAALTYLGSQVEGLSEGMKYALVAGAVAGGGLTVIANAPNPAGLGILKNSFDAEGISPVGLLLSAIGPTIVAMLALWLLPSF